LFAGKLYVFGGKIKKAKGFSFDFGKPTCVEMLQDNSSWKKVAEMTFPRLDAAAVAVKGNQKRQNQVYRCFVLIV